MSEKHGRTQAENLDTYSRLYRFYGRRHFVYEAKNKARIFQEYAKDTELARHGLRILDYGFGFGHILFSFGKDNEICGIELSQEAVAGAERLARKKGYPRFDFRVSDGTSRLPCEDGTFDLIICSHVLEHVEHADRLLSEFERLLAEQGRIIILLPINEGHHDPKHAREIGLEELQGMAAPLDMICRDAQVIDRVNPYVMSFWTKGYHKKWSVPGSFLSGFWNLVLILTPGFVFRGLEGILERKGKKPRQLIVTLQKKLG
jgi:SAM-dependent methyltransferase